MLYAFLSLAARDAMTRSVVTVAPDQSLAELEHLFEDGSSTSAAGRSTSAMRRRR